MDFQFLIESKQKTIACDVEFQTVFGLQVFYFSRFLRQYTTGISSLKMTFIESNFDVQSCTTFRIKIEYEIEFHSVFTVKILSAVTKKKEKKRQYIYKQCWIGYPKPGFRVSKVSKVLWIFGLNHQICQQFDKKMKKSLHSTFV